MMALIARNQEIDFLHYSVRDFRLEVEDEDVSGDVMVGPTCQSQQRKKKEARGGCSAGATRAGSVGLAQLGWLGWPLFPIFLTNLFFFFNTANTHNF